MVKRKHDPGYKLPEVINPEKNCCICIPIPNDFNHKMAFLGQLDELGYWWNWERDDEHLGTQAAQVWRTIVECIREDLNMSDCGCGDEKPTNTRINPTTGLYEVSYDGGITWEPDRPEDPRSSGTVFPPGAGDPGYETRCKAANSALGFLQEVKAAELEGLENNASIAEFLTMLTGFLAAIGLAFAFVPAAVAALLAFVVNFFGRKIAADFEAAFDEPLWDELFCILYCHIEDDGSYTEAGWQEVKNDLDNDISNYGLGWMYNHINLIGMVGLTNAARASYVGTRECDECECNCGASLSVGRFSGDPSPAGTILDRGDNYVQVQLDDGGYGNFRFTTLGDCCFVSAFVEDSGNSFGSAFIACGGVYVDEGSWTVATPIGQCPQVFQFQGDANAILTINLGECP